jgi:hypothetical protein
MHPGTNLVRHSRGNGVRQILRATLVLIDNMSTDVKPRYRNGHLGLIVAQNTSQRYPNIFSSLWDCKSLQQFVPLFIR